MSGIEDYYIEKTKRILLNSTAQRQRFINCNYGYNTPIDSKALEDVPRGKIVLNESVFKELLQINDESEVAKAEFSYILMGETEGQTVRFDNIIWCKNTGASAEADFTPLVGKLNTYVNSVQQLQLKNQIICNGHTHPKNMSSFAEDFSLYDMAGFIQMKEKNEVFRNGTVELCSGILSDLNFNFCFYDRNMENFYKFNDVVLELDNGKLIPLSCFGRKISRRIIADKLVDDEFER